MIAAELSASDDSSLSDGLLLEEGEMSRLWGFARFANEVSQRDWKVEDADEGRGTS